MGRGKKDSNDAPMSKSIDLLRAVAEVQEIGEGFGGAGGQAEQSFCSVERVIPFLTEADASLAVGQAARLQLGSPPAVIVAGIVVGEVTEPHAQAMNSCLRMGYRMAGTIASIHEADGKATLSVAGEQTQAA